MTPNQQIAIASWSILAIMVGVLIGLAVTKQSPAEGNHMQASVYYPFSNQTFTNGTVGDSTFKVTIGGGRFTINAMGSKSSLSSLVLSEKEMLRLSLQINLALVRSQLEGSL